jgi:hypothetical protein
MQTMDCNFCSNRWMDVCMGYSPIDSKRGFAQVVATGSINWTVCLFGATNFARSREVETRAIFFFILAKGSHCEVPPFGTHLQDSLYTGVEKELLNTLKMME